MASLRSGSALTLEKIIAQIGRMFVIGLVAYYHPPELGLVLDGRGSVFILLVCGFGEGEASSGGQGVLPRTAQQFVGALRERWLPAG